MDYGDGDRHCLMIEEMKKQNKEMQKKIESLEKK